MASTITFKCYSCNQVLKVGSDKAGKKAKCIKCGTILTIPAASDEEEVEEVRAGPPRKSSVRDEDDEPRRKRRDKDEDDDRPRKRGRDDDDDEDRPRSRRGRDDDEDEDDRPRRRRGRDEDDEDDDRPRSRRGRDVDDEDDYDRPRKRSRDRDDDDDDYDRGRRRRGGGNPWPKVRVALMLNGVSAGLLAGYAGLMLLGLIMVFIAGRAQSIGLLRFAGVLFLIAFILFFALQIPSVIAYVFFLFTPNKKGSLGLAITSLALGGINLVLKLLMILAILDAGTGGPGPGGPGPGLGGPGFMPPIFGARGSVAVAIMLMILVLLLLDSEWIIVPLYLRAVSKIIKDRYSEGSCMPTLGFGCGAIGAQILPILLALAATSVAMVWVLFFLQLIAFAVLIAFAIMYMRLNLGVRANVD